METGAFRSANITFVLAESLLELAGAGSRLSFQASPSCLPYTLRDYSFTRRLSGASIVKGAVLCRRPL